MNITIFGGTGTAGLLVVEKALSAGHRVTLYARNPSKISIQHNNLNIVKGELTEVDKIDEAVKRADAVISILGPKAKSKELVISNGIKNIINAMQKNGIKRLIATVSSSYRDANDKFQFWFDFGVVMLKVIGNSILKDIIETGEQIAKSQLDWTMVRLPKLSNNPPKEKLNIGYTGDGKIKFFSLTRSDLSDYLIQQLGDKTYLRKAPVISN
jgi:ketol-acid reductoisomerase